MSNDMMKRTLAVFAVGLLAATSLAAENVWHYRPTKDSGKGTYGYLVSRAENWTNEIATITGTPPRGAKVKIHDNSGLKIGTDNGAHEPWGDVDWQSGDASPYYLCVTSGAPIKMRCNPFTTSGLYLYGDGETFIDSDRDLTFQKAFMAKEGSPTFVKKGSWKLTCFYQGGNRDYTFPLTKLQQGTLNISTYKVNQNVEIRFDGPLQSRLEIGVSNANGNTNLTFKSSAITESADAVNSDHGITSSYDRQLCFTGTPTVNPMVFTGQFLGSAGLQWKPDSADSVFVLSNAVSTTTGRFYVSNGTVRVTSGAGFSALSLMAVNGANSRFEVDASAVKKLPVTRLALSNGGKIKVAAGVCLNVSAVTADGVAVADGFYCSGTDTRATQVNWIDGGGYVCIGSVPEAAQSGATWTGGGSDTLSDTAANWSGGVPTLTDGGTYVNVQGGSGFTAADDVWLNGFDLRSSSAFTLAAASGKSFWMGSGGVKGGTGTYTIDTPLVFTSTLPWHFRSGAIVNFNKPMDGYGASELVINGTNAVYNVNGSLGPKGFQVTFEYKSTINIAAGVTNEANIRVWNDYTAEKNNEYWWGSSTYRKPMVFKAGAPTVMNGFVHDTNCDYRITFEANSDVTFNGGFKARDAANFTVGAGARVRFNARLLSRNQFKPAFNSTGVIELNARANCLGCSNPWDRSFDKGTLKLLVPYALEDTTVSNEFEYKGVVYTSNAIGNFELCGTAVLDFCGNDQSLCCLAARGGIVTSETDAVLTLNAKDWGGDTTRLGITSRVDNATWAGGVGLVYNGKSATFPRFMMQASSTTGRLEVVQGRLVFAKAGATPITLSIGTEAVGYYPRPSKDASWTNCCEVTVRGGTLELEHKNTFGRQVAVKFVKTGGVYGKIDLADGVSERVYSLEIDGESQRLGTYGATGSGAKYVNDTLFSGSGVLSVLGDGQGLVIMFK